MKKMILKAALIVAVFTTCSTIADAQSSNVLSGLASALSGNSSNSSSSDGGILSTIGSMFSSKLVPTSTQIVGTWVYQEPAVVLTSNNILTTSAGKLASKQIETKLQSYLAKVGIKKGKASLTFNEDKTFSFNYGTKKLTGTYTIDNSKISLTFKGKSKASKLTPQLEDGSLVIAADATAIKTFMQNIGSSMGVSSLNTVSTLLKQFNGMQIGMRLEKQK